MLASAHGRSDQVAVSLASTAHNRVALLASDCGLPELAERLCWDHFAVFARARPLGSQVAVLALQPVVNLARLRLRSGDCSGAYDLLSRAYESVRHRQDATLNGVRLPFGELFTTGDVRLEAVRWLWTVLLADGTRALVQAGRWKAAAEHLTLHDGIGERLLDGRQVIIVASCLDGDPVGAQRMVASSCTQTAWERAVRSCLALLCRLAEQQPASKRAGSSEAISGPTLAAGETPGHTAADWTTAVSDYLTVEQDPRQVLFWVRLGLCLLDLGSVSATGPISQLAAKVDASAAATVDAYAAREILAHSLCSSLLPTGRRRELQRLLADSGLGQRRPPVGLGNLLRSMARESESALSRGLAATHRGR